jgi:hypothetical protein
MDSNSILSIVAIVVSVSSSIIAIFNHKRIRTHCCCSEKEIVMSIDIENTTPPNQPPPINIPKN